MQNLRSSYIPVSLARSSSMLELVKNYVQLPNLEMIKITSILVFVYIRYVQKYPSSKALF